MITLNHEKQFKAPRVFVIFGRGKFDVCFQNILRHAKRNARIFLSTKHDERCFLFVNNYVIVVG